ncbi:MAG TPA: efflux RND transporter permease subunit [Candidatus Absconditabacterales bacterium]|nr:efflux RND transporter permease subunit [Candidatus Absconditabacterales bacterium]
MLEKYKNISQKLESGFFGFRIKKRRVTFLLVGLIVVAGMMALVQIPKESSPKIEFGIISITTVYQGSTPEDVDSLITDKIEKEIKDTDGVKKISSTSAAGVSSVLIEFDNDADMTQALVDIKDNVDSVDLPSDAEDPIVKDISANNEMMFGIVIYGDEDKFSQFYLREKGRELKANLEGQGTINRIDFNGSMNSVGMVNSDGDSFYDIEVLLNKQKIEDLGLSILQVRQAIQSRNSNQPLGNHTVGELSYDFRIQGELNDIQELRDVPINTQKGTIHLEDIATIQKVLNNDNIQKAGTYQLSGQNYVTLIFNKEKGDNISNAAKEAKILLEDEFEKTTYKGLNYVITQDIADMLSEDYNALAKNGLQTLVLVFIALLIFVGFKESLIASITIPLAFLITFIVLKNLGLSMNFLTNFSLIVTFGIAIDTTIVLIEGAHEKMRQGFTPKHSILLAVREYKTPLISGTATTVCVFIPLLTLPGIMGKFLAYIPITIFATLVAALLISLTINSALYYKLSKNSKYFNSSIGDTEHMREEHKILLAEDRKGKVEKPEDVKKKREIILEQLSVRYSEKLGGILKNPKKRLMSVMIPIGALILSFIVIAPNLGFELFPAGDNGYISMTLEGPSGTTKESMEKYSKDIDNILSQQREIKVYYSDINSNTISTKIEMLAQSERSGRRYKDSQELEKYLDEEFAYLRSEGLKVNIKAQESGPPSSSPIGIKLVTDDIKYLNTLTQVSADFEDFLIQQPGTKNISSSSKKSPGQFVYTFDKAKMALMGLNPSSFNIEMFGVANGITAGTIKGDYDDNDIKLYFDSNKDNINPQTLDETNISTVAGSINFGNITDYEFKNAIQSISREDNNIIISVGADVAPGIKADGIQSNLTKFAQEYEFPEHITYSMGGENEENAELIQAIMVAFAVALLCIFGILVLQFNSYTQPVIILFSVAIGLLGGLIGLRITGQSFGLMFGIGFIALTGIVVNDAIVLLDRTNNNIKKGMKKIEAIKEAGKARLQPIILTTLTTFLGLTSIVGDAMRKPLAITIMVGIIFGSSVTLFVIPNIYFDKEKLKHIFRRTIIRYGIYLTLPLIITIAVMFILMILNVNTTGLFGKLFGAIFIGFNIRYSFYTIHARSTTGQTIIQKQLGIKILNKDNTILTEKQAIKRFFVAGLTTIGPLLAGLILMGLLGLISRGLGTSIGMIILIVGYLVIITKNMMSIRIDNHNTSIADKYCHTKTIDEKIIQD